MSFVYIRALYFFFLYSIKLYFSLTRIPVFLLLPFSIIQRIKTLLEMNCQIEILTKQTKSLEDSGCFVQLNWVCLGAFILQGIFSDNSLILQAQIFTFLRAERTFTQADSIIPTLWNWSCKECDSVNRMLLTSANIHQSGRGEKLSCQHSFCLHTVSPKSTWIHLDP